MNPVAWTLLVFAALLLQGLAWHYRLGRERRRVVDAITKDLIALQREYPLAANAPVYTILDRVLGRVRLFYVRNHRPAEPGPRNPGTPRPHLANGGRNCSRTGSNRPAPR